MKVIIYLLLTLVPLVSFAQTYKYLSTADGLSNQKIYGIRKDRTGYMWFLTHQGMDRYNGREIKHYTLTDTRSNMDTQTNLDWMYIDGPGNPWVIGRKGRIFKYDSRRDAFDMLYRMPQYQDKEFVKGISFGYLDRNNRIWLCYKDSVTLFDTQSQKIRQVHIGHEVTAVAQTDSTHFYIGTPRGIHYVNLIGDRIRQIPVAALDSLRSPINELYYHPATRKLFVGTFREGIGIYDPSKPDAYVTDTSLSDVNITRITQLNDSCVLVATDGQGVYSIGPGSSRAQSYIRANYHSYNEMNGNNINDIYVDDCQRIWLSNYPNGITIRDNRYTSYDWIRHSIGNSQSLINDQVHSVVEDSEGDLWFGTSNGISLYRSATGKWHSFLSSFEKETRKRNHIFLTVCEVSPGIIWAGGYTSGLYQINKRDLSVEYFSPAAFAGRPIRPDQYIRAIKTDSAGYVWSGATTT